MGMFADYKKQVDDAKLSGGGIYFKPGEYELEIEAVKGFKSRKKEAMFCADFVVISSTNEGFPPGSRVNYLVNMDQDWGPGNAKSFLIAATGLDPFGSQDAAAIKAEEWFEILEVSVTKPIFVGKKIRATCFAKKKKDSNETYDRVIFKPHEETRKALNLGGKK